MSRLAKYRKNDREQLKKLAAHGIKTTGDLWFKVGPKSDGVEKLAGDVGLTKDQLVEILVECAREQEARSGRWYSRFWLWLRFYWPEALGLAIALVLVSLLAYNAVQLQDTVVLGDKELPALHAIGAGDVKVAKRFKTYNSFRSERDVMGRYLLQPAKPGQILLSGQLAAAPASGAKPDARRLLSVPVKAGAIVSTLGPGSRARLLFSPRQRDAKAAAPALGDTSLEDVVVLAVNRQGDASSVLVAVKDDDELAKAASLLASSEVFVSQTEP